MSDTALPIPKLNAVSAMHVQIQLQQLAHEGNGFAGGNCPACRKFRPHLWRWLDAHKEEGSK